MTRMRLVSLFAYVRAFVSDESKRGFVLLAGLLFATRSFAPDFAVDNGKSGVAVDALVHLGDDKPGGAQERLRIDVGAAGDDDRARVAPQGVAARSFQRRVEIRRHHNSWRTEGFVTADHDRGAASKRLADRLVGLAPEHHRLAYGERAKMRHVRFQPPRQRIAAADHAILGNGADYNNVHGDTLARLHRHRGLDVRVRLVAFEGEILVG